MDYFRKYTRDGYPSDRYMTPKYIGSDYLIGQVTQGLQTWEGCWDLLAYGNLNCWKEWKQPCKCNLGFYHD